MKQLLRDACFWCCGAGMFAPQTTSLWLSGISLGLGVLAVWANVSDRSAR